MTPCIIYQRFKDLYLLVTTIYAGVLPWLLSLWNLCRCSNKSFSHDIKIIWSFLKFWTSTFSESASSHPVLGSQASKVKVNVKVIVWWAWQSWPSNLTLTFTHSINRDAWDITTLRILVSSAQKQKHGASAALNLYTIPVFRYLPEHEYSM